jgi:PilZ domain-containing protein
VFQFRNKIHVFIIRQRRRYYCRSGKPICTKAHMPSTQPGSTRREPRTRAAGEILIEVSPGGQVIPGQLLDVSRHGFSIQHEFEHFVTGQQVRVVYDWGKAPARLVWVEKRVLGLAAGFRTD